MKDKAETQPCANIVATQPLGENELINAALFKERLAFFGIMR